MASNRNNTDDRQDSKMENQVGKYIKQASTNRDADDRTIFTEIRQKYPDAKVAEKVFDLYKDRMALVTKKAYKFKNLIFSNYSHLALPSLLEKARKFKKKYELSDDEFHAFINLAISDRSLGQFNQYNQPNTPISKLLGQADDANLGKMNVSTNELDILQDILRIYAETQIFHQQLVTQSLQHLDCAPASLAGQYDERKHNSYNYIHPVVAALFLPRIKYIDEHMLLANLSYIVHCRYNGIPIRTLPDWEVYQDLRTDPNEIVCVSPNESPLVDLRNRVKLQVELWKQVFELRQGRYYSETFPTFNVALDACKNSVFSDPDMIYVRDEGTVIRKLFGAFSLRPTIISIASMTTTGIMSGNYSLGPMAAAQITSIPIVNLRLPLSYKHHSGLSINLNTAMEQYNWFVENKTLVPKVTNIIYSRDIIVFYANRRYQSINFGRLYAPYNFTMLPATHSALETINDVTVNAEQRLKVGDDDFILRSVVCVERSFLNKDLITGCSAAISLKQDPTSGVYESSHIVYDPQVANIMVEEGGQYKRIKPISAIPAIDHFNDDGTYESFATRSAKRGTIYIYVKDTPQMTIIRPQ